MSEQEFKRFEALRQRVFAYIEAYLEEDGHCKSYEGAWSLHFPNYFVDPENPSKWDEPYAATLHCYLLGPARHYDWRGKSWGEVFDRAEKDINRWIGEREGSPTP